MQTQVWPNLTPVVGIGPFSEATLVLQVGALPGAWTWRSQALTVGAGLPGAHNAASFSSGHSDLGNHPLLVPLSPWPPSPCQGQVWVGGVTNIWQVGTRE